MVMKDYDRKELLRLIKEANEITKIMTNPDSYRGKIHRTENNI